ncbi:hypothetical protein SRHO_G00334760 [Serrasalmus rhombeus]
MSLTEQIFPTELHIQSKNDLGALILFDSLFAQQFLAGILSRPHTESRRIRCAVAILGLRCRGNLSRGLFVLETRWRRYYYVQRMCKWCG